VDASNARIVIGGAIEYWATTADPYRTVPLSAFYQPREIFVVENNVTGVAQNGPSGNLYGAASQLALLSNNMGIANEHTVRLFRAHKTVIAHNAIRGISSDGIRHALKLHSGEFGQYADAYAVSGSAWATSKVVLADNLMGDPADNNAWTVAIRPQNSGPDSGEGIEDVVIERNRFARGPVTNTDILTVGRRITTRANTRIDGGPLAISRDTTSDYPLLPTDWRGPYYQD
jgi:hypothetical protein